VPIPVVVEVGEDVPPGPVPFIDAGSPPVEVVLGVGAGVEVVVIGAVKADLDERGGRS
jgi:hypothetical protein